MLEGEGSVMIPRTYAEINTNNYGLFPRLFRLLLPSNMLGAMVIMDVIIVWKKSEHAEVYS